MVLADRFEPEVLDIIVGLLAPGSLDTQRLRETVDTLFAVKWKARTWSDLMVFSSTDVTTALVPGEGVPEDVPVPVIVKKLGYIVDFARRFPDYGYFDE